MRILISDGLSYFCDGLVHQRGEFVRLKYEKMKERAPRHSSEAVGIDFHPPATALPVLCQVVNARNENERAKATT
jgi:hypothetical protein